MTEESGANDDLNSDGITLLLQTTNSKSRSSDYLYISGYEITKLLQMVELWI